MFCYDEKNDCLYGVNWWKVEKLNYTFKIEHFIIMALEMLNLIGLTTIDYFTKHHRPVVENTINRNVRNVMTKWW